MKINMTARRLTISDEQETVEFSPAQKPTIAALIKQKLGF